MIKFTLKCDKGHRFDSWFKSAKAFDDLHRTGHLNCAVCGTTSVEKALMAPSVREGREGSAPVSSRAPAPIPDVTAQALAELRKHVEANSDYVGDRFAREARDIHDGLIPARPIHGEARPDEARRLAEDGVPVVPLPFTPKRKSN